MTTTVFFRLLKDDDKASALAESVAALTEVDATTTDVYAVELQSFQQVPGSPFAYWVSDGVRRLFTELPQFECGGRKVRQGLATGDDFRFVRMWSEIGSTLIGTRWYTYVKGGKLRPYYSNVPTVINWENDGADMKHFADRRTHELFGKASWSRWINNVDDYFRPGLTWPLRAARFAPIPMPAGSIFSKRGYAAFSNDSELPFLLGLGNSVPMDFIFKTLLGRFGYPEFVVGVLQRLPLPEPHPAIASRLGRLGLACVKRKRDLDTVDETSRVFIRTALLKDRVDSLSGALSSWSEWLAEVEAALALNQAEIDDIAFRLYGISDKDRRAIEVSLSGGVAEEPVGQVDADNEDEVEAANVGPSVLVDELISWTIGCAFGRWDVRLALVPSLAPKLQGPFDPLPVCSPGMLVGPDGLPAKPNGIASEEWLRARPDAITLPEEGTVSQPTIPDDEYPLRIDWDGIMVDDEGHPDDIVGRVREVLHLLWVEQAEVIEREACEILGVKDLREYLRNPRRFWDAHVKRYSKSRRKAPIYWLLQSSRRNYGLWLYYHRMDADILYKALRNYVDPKIALERNRLEEMRARLPEAQAAGGRTRREAERSFDQQAALVSEIEEFRQTLERVTLLGLTVDHDDGVLLSIAPLHELVPWKPAAQAWKELVAGKYEWSTMSQRMREKGLVRARQR